VKEQVSELLEIIRDEIRSYHDLLECEQRKTVLLTGGRVDVEELMNCNKTEEESVVRLQELEARRLSLCGKLCEEFEIPREEFTLTRLAEFLDNPNEFDESAALLRNVAQSVQVVGAHNQALIEKPLRYTEGMLSIFSNAVVPYQPNGTFNLETFIHPTFSKNA